MAKAPHDTWVYSKDGAKIIKAGETIPKGWVDTPAKVTKGKQSKK